MITITPAFIAAHAKLFIEANPQKQQKIQALQKDEMPFRILYSESQKEQLQSGKLYFKSLLLTMQLHAQILEIAVMRIKTQPIHHAAKLGHRKILIILNN